MRVHWSNKRVVRSNFPLSRSRLQATAKARLDKENAAQMKGKDPDSDCKILAFPVAVENWEQAWNNVMTYARPYSVSSVLLL